MENRFFENLSQIEICREMAKICQKSANASLIGADKERFQTVSDYFRAEADTLTSLQLKAPADYLL